MPSSPVPERRCGPDRRHNRLLPALFSKHRRRRSTGRRFGDKVGYVDYYPPRTWILAIAVLGMSLLDAVLTSVEVLGGKTEEINPLMNVALSKGGVYTFVSLKAVLTAVPLSVLILHKEWPLAKMTVRLCLWCYVLISLYHFYIVFGCPA
jgi:hypothetical protein